jgi:hypothetical protein
VTPPRDPMRNLGWGLAVLGLLLVALAGGAYAIRYLMLSMYQPHPWTGTLGRQLAADALEAVSFPSGAVLTGIAVAAFGMLLLAIRPPMR